MTTNILFLLVLLCYYKNLQKILLRDWVNGVSRIQFYMKKMMINKYDFNVDKI